MPALDWQGVLAGQPLHWILSGFLTTLWVTLAGIMLASLLALFFMLLRLSGGRFGTLIVSCWVSLFRNTPLLVQLLFWYFAAWNGLPQGLRSVPAGQREAALAQGFSSWRLFRYILLPQGLANAWQPVVGQYLNLMKLSSLASGIGFAELTYQVRQIESYNAHALEAFTVGTVLYLLTGMVTGSVLVRLGPHSGRKYHDPRI